MFDLFVIKKDSEYELCFPIWSYNFYMIIFGLISIIFSLKNNTTISNTNWLLLICLLVKNTFDLEKKT